MKQRSRGHPASGSGHHLQPAINRDEKIIAIANSSSEISVIPFFLRWRKKVKTPLMPGNWLRLAGRTY